MIVWMKQQDYVGNRAFFKDISHISVKGEFAEICLFAFRLAVR